MPAWYVTHSLLYYYRPLNGIQTQNSYDMILVTPDIGLAHITVMD